jgi:hypothetical protein
MNKIAASATAFFDEVRNDPSIRSAANSIAWCCRSSTGSRATAICRSHRRLKRDLLARPELGELARTSGQTRTFIDRSAAGESEVLQHHLAGCS